LNRTEPRTTSDTKW